MRAIILALAASVCILSAPAATHEFTAKGVTVAHPWVRATPGGAKVGGAFLEMKAAKGHSDRLVSASSPVAGSVEIHNHIMEGGVVRMRRVDGIALGAGKSVVLAPGGYHVMLMDLKQPLKEGDLLRLTLVFEKAGPIEVEATVEPIGAKGPHGFDHQPGAPKSKSKGAHDHKH